MGEVSSMGGRDEKCLRNFSRKKVNGRHHFGYLGVEGTIIFKWLLKKMG